MKGFEQQNMNDIRVCFEQYSSACFLPWKLLLEKEFQVEVFAGSLKIDKGLQF